MNRGLLVALAIGVAAATGFFVQRSMQPAVPAAVEAEGAPATATADAAPAPTAEPTVPETLPQFELADRDGKMRTLGEWTGQPLLVNYWATWCGPCRREIPLLNQLRKDYAAQKLEVIGIAVDFRDDVLNYVKETALSYPLLIGEEDGLEAVKAMGMQAAFPFSVFADSQQRIVALKVGELHREEAELIMASVAAVDSGALPLEQARSQIQEGLKAIAVKRATE